jgi:hypothetical protein
VKFVERREFSGDPDEVWGRVSNLGAIPSYWHGTKEFKITGAGDKTTADVIFAFGGKGRAWVTVNDASKTLTIDYLEGPIKGAQKVAVMKGLVEAAWDVTFKGALKLLAPWGASHFRSGTKNALRRLCEGTTE